MVVTSYGNMKFIILRDGFDSNKTCDGCCKEHCLWVDGFCEKRFGIRRWRARSILVWQQKVFNVNTRLIWCSKETQQPVKEEPEPPKKKKVVKNEQREKMREKYGLKKQTEEEEVSAFFSHF